MDVERDIPWHLWGESSVEWKCIGCGKIIYINPGDELPDHVCILRHLTGVYGFALLQESKAREQAWIHFGVNQQDAIELAYLHLLPPKKLDTGRKQPSRLMRLFRGGQKGRVIR
jgi:hypothetical protein